MVRQTKLNEWEIGASRVLIAQLRTMTDELESNNVSSKQLGEIIEDMETIKLKMRKHITLHKQWEAMEQYLEFDEIIKFVRDLQNKKDATAM